MQVVYVTKGLPACGKSSLGSKMMEQNKNLRLVSKDDIRKLLYRDSKWNARKEPLVVEMENLIIRELLVQQHDVFVHDTNLASGHIERIKHIADQFNAETIVIDMTDVSIIDCIRRDHLRENSVGWRVILGMAESNLKPAYEAFRRDYPTDEAILQDLFDQRVTKLNSQKENAIIVDIDGTLAIMGNRSPYEFAKVTSDRLYSPLATLINQLSQNFIILFLSGRDEECRTETEAWLDYHKMWFPYSELHMRSDGDNRQDSIVKEELWREFVEPRFNTICIFDDRAQVVKMWRQLGLPCFQVNYGDF